MALGTLAEVWKMKLRLTPQLGRQCASAATAAAADALYRSEGLEKSKTCRED